uniref:Structural maintenance of chromosomes protein 3 n=1 Tax=Phlebotomus papatasi TaxID=29031 RepID=A0A1B0CYF8_PHLPP
MISKLKYEEQYDKALRYIFGKILICRNLERATELAKSTGLDCVTLEGDQVSSKGCLTGGYFNTSRSRLEMQKKRSEFMELIRDHEEELSSLRGDLKQTESSINSVVSEMQKTETKQGKSKDIFDKVQADIRLMKEELTRIERFRNPKERSLAQCKANLEAMNSTKEGLESELHQELMSQLSTHDQREVDQLNDDIRRLNQENKEAFSARMTLEVTKNKLENLLTNNLFRRRDELVQALQEISVEDRKRQLNNCRNELAATDKRIKKVNQDLEDMDKRLEKEAQEKIDDDSKRLEKWTAKENLLHQKIEDATEKIASLGALPQADPAYTRMSLKNLFKELEKANQHLKKYNHVNKKALDQFLSFSEQKEKLCKRKEELDIGDQKIRELMQSLEMRKVEAIQFTFKQVAQNFTKVFKKLVPQGSGHLVLKTKDSESEDIDPGVATSDAFIGIGIRVSFTGADAEMREMNQLSGGQKSLVALALIFSIQKCDPAPFYLFDEIDQVIIQGFKSYREQTIVEPFDKRHNVVVGRNGSGKSNFFYAIQFVLSDEFTHLRPEQRQGLLHEGTGARVMSAYVEIIFDNSDNRVPIEKEEICLRRVIGAKKDQYFLNKKVVPRTEVVNLLEAAGFSNSNPYYIVKQGKINEMATAADAQRLKLLREVAGTRVYDERKEESMNILKETEGKVEKITEFLITIEERLRTLEEEKEELKEYQKWDKARRTLEYIIHETELKDTKKQLDELEHQRRTSGDKQKQLLQEVQKAQEKIKGIQKNLKDAKKEVTGAKEDRSVLSAEQQQLLREKTKLDLTIHDLTDEVQGDNKSKERAEQELERLKVTISEKEKELEDVRPRYEAMRRKEEEYSRELALKEQKRKELYAKQGRGSQFSSRDERDKWIQNELKSLNKQIKDKISHQNKLTDDLKRDATKQKELERKIEDHGSEVEQLRLQIDEHNKQYYELKKKKDQYQATRNELWRKETQITQTLSSHKEELSKADQALRSMAGKPILNGRDSVRKVLDSFKQRGGQFADIANAYYGPVIENFNCDKTIYTAVEVTAGNRLFHHIVESDRN